MTETKVCTSCMAELPLEDFGFQRTNPSKRYAWCKECKRANMPAIKPKFIDWAELRQKAEASRQFTPEQDAMLANAYRGGTKVAELAAQYHCNPNTVYKALKRQNVKCTGRIFGQ